MKSRNPLISRYFDDELSEAEAEELTAWVQQLPENAAEFVRAALTKKVMQKKFENVLLQRSVKKSLSMKKLSA